MQTAILVWRTGNSKITESLLNREAGIYQKLTNLTQTLWKKPSVSNPPPTRALPPFGPPSPSEFPLPSVGVGEMDIFWNYTLLFEG